jgi:hypothetical protein
MFRIIFFVLFALFLSACSKPSKETALDRINERMALNWMSNELSLQIGNKHKSFYSIGWRKSVAQDDIENVNKMQALVEVGLLNSVQSADRYIYSLTPEAWGSQVIYNTSKLKIYFGHYQAAVIKSMTLLDINKLGDEDIYIVEAELEVRDVQDWARNSRVQEQFPQLKKQLQNTTRKYVLFTSPDDKEGYLQTRKNVIDQLKAHPEYKGDNIQVIALNTPRYYNETENGKLIQRAKEASPASEAEIKAIIKEKMSSCANPGQAKIYAYRHYGKENVLFRQLAFGLVSVASEDPSRICYCRGDFMFEPADRELMAGVSTCKDFAEDPLKVTPIATK